MTAVVVARGRKHAVIVATIHFPVRHFCLVSRPACLEPPRSLPHSPPARTYSAALLHCHLQPTPNCQSRGGEKKRRRRTKRGPTWTARWQNLLISGASNPDRIICHPRNAQPRGSKGDPRCQCWGHRKGCARAQERPHQHTNESRGKGHLPTTKLEPGMAWISGRLLSPLSSWMHEGGARRDQATERECTRHVLLWAVGVAGQER